MKIKINTRFEYVGGGSAPVESFYLEVEKEVEDTEEAIVITYLTLRKMLKVGIKEESKCQ